MKMINSDPYSKFAIGYGIEWAEMMENEIDKNGLKTLEEIVEFLAENATKLSLETEHCNDGLTGFQQDYATLLLVHSWKYGFELWLGLGLEKLKKNYHMSKELMKYVTYYNEGNYGAIDTYKNECDGRYELETNTTHIGDISDRNSLPRLACYGGL